MDRLLKPQILNVDPGDPLAFKAYKHWIKTFNAFAEAAQQSLQTADQGEDTPNRGVDKLALLICYLSPEIYELVEDCENYETAKVVLDQTFLKRKNATYARHLLLTREQKLNETIKDYARALKLVAKDCEWRAVSAQEFQNELTRDAFITGLSSPMIKQRLLEEDSVSLEEAICKAEILERAQSQSSGLTLKLPTSSISSAASSSFKATKRRCYFCGGNLHAKGRDGCPAKDAYCGGCGKKGHYLKACKSSKRPVAAKISEENHELLSTTSDDETVAVLTSPCLLSLTGVPPCLESSSIQVKIKNKPVNALVDSGASHSHIDVKAAEWLQLPAPTGATTKVALAKHTATFKTLGKTVVELEAFGDKYLMKLGVCKNLCADLILGQDFMKMHRTVVFQLNKRGKDIVISRPVCGVAVANIPPMRLFKNLEPGMKPIATKSKRFNLEDQKFIRSEIKKLLDENIIEPSTSPWRAQVLIADDGRHKKRMVIDYSRTINKFTFLDAFPLPRIDDQVNMIASGKVFSTLDLKSAYYQIPICEADREYTAFEADGQLFQYTRLPFGVTNGVSMFQRVIQGIIQKYNLKDTYAYLDNVTIAGIDEEDHDMKLNALRTAAKKENLTFNEEKSVIKKTEIDLLGYRISHGVIKPDPERLKPLVNLPLPSCKSDLQRVVGMFAYYARWIPQFSERIRSLNLAVSSNEFPLPEAAANAFDSLKKTLLQCCLSYIRDDIPFQVDCDASEYAIAATLSQGERPVAFFSRTLSRSETSYSVIEKEALAIMEAVRRWSHYLHGKRFDLVTDQRALSFILSKSHNGKVKNNKIQLWKTELSSFDYRIHHRPGKLNVVPDTLSRSKVTASLYPSINLKNIHKQLGHPGVTRMTHFVRSKNLPFSVEDIKHVCNECFTCAKLKPQYFTSNHCKNTLIKATRPWERISVDFKGPVSGTKPYILIVVDEYSRFPFAFPCKDQSATTIMNCLSQLFVLFGLPMCVHSDRGAGFMAKELKEYLTIRGVSTSNSTPYHPTGNSQVERTNKTVWKTVQLMLTDRKLPQDAWQSVLPEALHAVRSLLCTTTNATPHERFLGFERRSMLGKSLPAWLLQPGTVFLRRFIRNKDDPLVEEVELLRANPSFAQVRFPSGRESSVSTNDLAPLPTNLSTSDNSIELTTDDSEPSQSQQTEEISEHEDEESEVQTRNEGLDDNYPPLRRSSRLRKPPGRYRDFITH